MELNMSHITLRSPDLYFKNLRPRTDTVSLSTQNTGDNGPTQQRTVTLNHPKSVRFSKATPGRAVRATSARVFRKSRDLDINKWKVVKKSDDDRRMANLQRAQSVSTKSWIQRNQDKFRLDESIEEISVDQAPISKEEKVKKWITRDATLHDVRSLKSVRSLDTESIAGTFTNQSMENKKLKAIEETFDTESSSGKLTVGTASRREIMMRDVPFVNSPEETAYLLAVRITNKMIKDGWYELFGPICYIDVVKDGEFYHTCTVRLGMWDSSTHHDFIKVFNGTMEKLKFYGKTLIMKSVRLVDRIAVKGWENPEAPVTTQPGKLSPIKEVVSDEVKPGGCCSCCLICCAKCSYLGVAFQMAFSFFTKTVDNYKSEKVGVSNKVEINKHDLQETNLDSERY